MKKIIPVWYDNMEISNKQKYSESGNLLYWKSVYGMVKGAHNYIDNNNWLLRLYKIYVTTMFQNKQWNYRFK